MKEKCAFCNGSKVELVDGLGVPCVWCDPVGTAIADDKLERDGVTAAPVAAPMPPAGDVEVLTNKQIREKRYAEDQAFHSWAFNKQGAAIGRMNGQVAGLEAWHARGEIADAELTRLTAERDGVLADVKALTEHRDELKLQRDRWVRMHNNLQSELTKAREALESAESFWSLREKELGCISPEAQAVRNIGLAALDRTATPIVHNIDESCGQDAEAAKGDQS